MVSHCGPCCNDVPAIFGTQVEIFSLPQPLWHSLWTKGVVLRWHCQQLVCTLEAFHHRGSANADARYVRVQRPSHGSYFALLWKKCIKYSCLTDHWANECLPWIFQDKVQPALPASLSSPDPSSSPEALIHLPSQLVFHRIWLFSNRLLNLDVARPHPLFLF